MKKIFLLAVVAGLVSVTSCKKSTQDKVNDAVEQTQDAAAGVADDVAQKADEVYESAKAAVTDAPQFEDAELQEWANRLYDAAVEAKVAAEKGDQDTLNVATAKITSLAETLETQKDKAEYAKAEDYYKQVQAELQK